MNIPIAFSLHPIDLVIMVVYLASIIYIGLRFSRKARTTEGYFLGDKSSPSWVLGLSIISAKISSVTFLALPAAAFALDWRLFVPNLAIIPVALLAIWLLVPFFRQAAHTTAFEYLNNRFGVGARLYGSILFLVGQALRLGSIVYLAAIPIELFTGIPPIWIMVLIGGICTLYTVVGGIQAVIWTDAIQAIILYLGGIAALAVMINGVPGGIVEIFKVASADGKFSLGPMNWDLSDRTFWTMLIVGLNLWIFSYTSDQVLIQRYLAAKDLKQARAAGWSSAFLCLPTWAFFFLLGTSLYVYFKVNPSEIVGSLPADSVFPHFILTQMPHGLSGLVIAGVIAAAMGSLSSALNAFATVATVDIVRPYVFKGKSDPFYAVAAKLLTGFGTILMLAIGFAFNAATKESFVDLSQQLAGIIGGVVPAFFLLGFFAARVNSKVLWQAFTVAFLLNTYLALVEWELIPNFLSLHVHPYLVSSVVLVVMIMLAVILSMLQRVPPERRPGLMVFSKDKEESKILNLESQTIHE